MLTWIGLLAEKTVCANHIARETCAQMRDGLSIESDGIALVAIRMHGKLVAYGRIVQSLPLPDGDEASVRRDRRMADRMIKATECAMNRLGISGPVEMYELTLHESVA